MSTRLVDLDAALVDYCTSQAARPTAAQQRALDAIPAARWLTERLPSIKELIDTTGLHPIASHRAPGRHAAPWCADRVLADALDGLDRVEPITPRHKARAGFFPGDRIPLTSEEVRAALWTVKALTDD